MNGVNTLFVISCVFVPLLLISINYSSIGDYYMYSVPLNSLTPNSNFFENNEIKFQEVYNDVNSECLTTPNENLFCYKKPKTHSEDVLISYMIGENGIDGEMHFDPVEDGAFYFLMLDITKGTNDSVVITFADKGYKIGADNHASLSDSFEFSTNLEPFDTFVSHCNTEKGKAVTIVQYLGIKTIDDKDYFVTWHMPADSETGVTCEYPQLIQHSLNHNFREL